tara:strand:+ start:1347 stop:1556 length:210 start_codon:yes stop_codon:yes gene_type:complete
MKTYLLVIAMIGITEDDDRVYIGSQMVLNQEMTLEQCEFMADPEQWTKWWGNIYYEMDISCHEKGTALK